MRPIITATELTSEMAGSKPPVLLDVRWQLGRPDLRAMYEQAHIPGAVFVDLDTELAAAAGLRRAASRCPTPVAFGAAMRRGGGLAGTPRWSCTTAGRAGRRRVPGGCCAGQATRRSGFWTVVSRPGRGRSSASCAGPRAGRLRAGAGIRAAAGRRRRRGAGRDGVLFDARAAERYRGDVEPIDRVGGHIPGAVSAPTTANIGPDGRFLPPENSPARFPALGATADDGEVGVYCGSGVSGAHEVLALAVAGIPAALYVGSWSEWSSDPSRPVATGPDPQLSPVRPVLTAASGNIDQSGPECGETRPAWGTSAANGPSADTASVLLLAPGAEDDLVPTRHRRTPARAVRRPLQPGGRWCR